MDVPNINPFLKEILNSLYSVLNSLLKLDKISKCKTYDFN